MNNKKTHISIPVQLDELLEKELILFNKIIKKSKNKLIDYIYNYDKDNYGVLYFDLIYKDACSIFNQLGIDIEEYNVCVEKEYFNFDNFIYVITNTIINNNIRNLNLNLKEKKQIFVRGKYDKETLINKLILYFSNPPYIRERVFFDYFYNDFCNKINTFNYLCEELENQKNNEYIIYKSLKEEFSIHYKEDCHFDCFKYWDTYKYKASLCVLYAILIKNQRNFFVLYSIENKKAYIIDSYDFLIKEDNSNVNYRDLFHSSKQYIDDTDIEIINNSIKKFKQA